MVLRGGPKGEAHVPSKSTKKQVRDATLTDSTGSIPVSIWGEHITSVKEGEFYTFTECRLRHYYGKCLTTTQSTTVSAAEKQDISKAVQQDVQTWICCPKIVKKNCNYSWLSHSKMPPLQQIKAGQKLLFRHDSQSQLIKRWQTILSDFLFQDHFYISK